MGDENQEGDVAYSTLFGKADGIYVKAGIGREKGALLVVTGALKDGRRRFLALEVGYRESEESRGVVLRDLKARGV